MSARLQQDPSLYRGLLGARFDVLPARVRELHDVTETAIWVGRADVERGRAWFARLVAALLSLPPDGRDQRLQVSFEPGAWVYADEDGLVVAARKLEIRPAP